MKPTSLLRAAALLVMLALLAGCWDLKSIQDTNYITAVGFDYKNGKYVIYAQLLDFANVAKQENGKPGQPATVWSGREEADTIVSAMAELYKSSQQRVFWGHVSAIVFTENALKQGLHPYIDGLIRFREVRYTQWVYGTKEPIDRVFTTFPFFNLTPIASILHQPEDQYRQQSYIRPLRLSRVLALLREPDYTLLLPALAVTENTWKRNGENDPKLKINGLFPMKVDKALTWVPDEQLAGLRWLNKDTPRSPVTIERDGRAAAAIFIEKPRPKVMPGADSDGGAPSVSVHLRCSASVSELFQELSTEEIERETAKAIRRDIEQTYEYGDQHGLDLYGFGHELYRKKFAVWNKLTRGGETPLPVLPLASVTVDVHLTHSGMYKLNSDKPGY